MAEKPVENVTDVKIAVDSWFTKLQQERKCKSTNTISKIVNNSPEEVQEQVRELIAHSIKELVRKSMKSKDLMDMLNTCNTINGCFDNFMHATDAVSYSFTEVLLFVDCAIDECQLNSQNDGKNLIVVLELLHCLSRILILILKLRRDWYKGKKKCASFNCMIDNIEEKKKLCSLTCKIGPFLTRDDVLIDTKNNFAMSAVLIREILTPDSENLKVFQRQFLSTIPSTLKIEGCKTYVVQFLISAALLNTWSTKILDPESTYIYLNFFINLCESFSSETPIILNTSRALLLLIKHNCFKELLAQESDEKVKEIADSLLSCVFMLLEHPVACVRHSAKEFLVVLAPHTLLQPHIIKSIFTLPKDKRSYFICVNSIANEMGSRVLIKRNTELPKHLLDSIHDPTMISHVSGALESMILNDAMADEEFDKWCELWIIPLLITLKNALPIVAAEIDKLLEKAFKKYPNSVLYVIEKWKHPKSGEELRCVITTLKINQKQGANFKTPCNTSTAENIRKDTKNKKGTEKKWKTLISEKLLKHCLHHGEDEIRISAFALIVEARRSTEPYSSSDFKLIEYFLKYNLNNQHPASRQKIYGLIRKMLVRFSDSRAGLRRMTKKDTEITEKLLDYDQFLNSLVEFCFVNIFVGCNFNRLNTVLTILFICFETVKDMSFDSKRTNYYWSKFLIALDSSYEENKELAVILSRKLDFASLDAARQEKMKLLFEKSFSLITHMEPPDVLTGSYLLQALISLPLAKQALSMYLFGTTKEDFDVQYSCMEFLKKKLKEQVLVAKLDLMTAATCGPMYGTLSAIRLIFKNINLCLLDVNGTERKESSLKKWKKLLNDLVEICFDMIPTVASVVNSSSPEGHLPMDFQTNFEQILKISCPEGAESAFRKERDEIISSIFDSHLEKFKRIENAMENTQFDVYEILRDLKCLLKENKLLTSKLDDSTQTNYLNQLKVIREKIEHVTSTLDKNNVAVDWPATAQVLLLCAWRSIKEASLYLGDLVSKLPVETAIELEFLSVETIINVGEKLKVLLCEIKHRGSFEHVYVAFTQFVNSLWKSSYPNLSNLPRQWLLEIGSHLELPIKGQKLKLCSTRRSAGLPFLVQAVICSEIVSVKSPTPSTLHSIMSTLLKITEKGVTENSDSIIHALNIMRALFKHAQLGEHVSSYISKALMVAIRGSRGPTWSERNSSNLLFSSLVIRIFGVSRSRDEISKKNRMTSRTFFQRYSEMYEFLLSEMKLVHSNVTSDGFYPKPSLYLVLLILGRLYPTPRDDTEILDLTEFLPFINKSRRNPIMKIRELAARALVPLVPPDRLMQELNDRFALLRSNGNVTQNEMHGIILQIIALLKESVDIVNNLTENYFGDNEIPWIENTCWILSEDTVVTSKISFVVVSSYIKVLHILYKFVFRLRQKISDLVLHSPDIEKLCSSDQWQFNSHPGIYLCLENFYVLKVDIVAHNSLQAGNVNNFSNLLLFMLNSHVEEVRSVPLRVFCSVLQSDIDNTFEDDYLGIAAFKREVLVLQKNETLNELRMIVVSHSEILKLILKTIYDSTYQTIKSKTICRLWLKSCSDLITGGSVSVVSNLPPELADLAFRTNIGCLEPLLQSNDKEISSNALVIYSVHMFEEIVRCESTKTRADKIDQLSTVLKKFSSTESDVKEKLAVARILNHCFDNMMRISLFDDMNIWLVPIKLLLDEDTTVRMMSTNFVCKMLAHLGEYSKFKSLQVEMEILDWPTCPLVSLKAQECLFDSYFNISKKENLINLLTHLLTVAFSSLSESADYDGFSNSEFGVFEKGNPNPYCEELAVSNMICEKLTDLRKQKTLNVIDLMKTSLSEKSMKLLSETFNVPILAPVSLMEMIEKIKEIADVGDGDKDNEFSVLRTQKKNLIDALGLSGDIYTCPREGRHYEVLLKKKCFRKLKDNVWENRQKWKLLIKADRHYKLKIMQKCFNKWINYVDALFVKRLNLRLADSFYDELILTKGLTALKKNVQRNRSLIEYLQNKVNFNLKRLAWHRWKHYTLMRLKVERVKHMADKIRKKRLLIKILYLWVFRFKEKMYLKDAIEKSKAKYKTKLIAKYLNYWRIQTKERIVEKHIKQFSVTFYKQKIMKKAFHCWKKYIERIQALGNNEKIVNNLRKYYLIEHYIQEWSNSYEIVSQKRELRNNNAAVLFHNKQILKKCLRRMYEAKERKKLINHKSEEFNLRSAQIYITFYLDVWMTKKNEKLQWIELENKAREWRTEYLVEIFLEALTEKYTERIEERERTSDVINYVNFKILQKAFDKWREVTTYRIIKREMIKNCRELYDEKLKKKFFHKMREFALMKWQKKMAVAYWNTLTLDRAMTNWKNFLNERREVMSRAEELNKLQNQKTLTWAFSIWKSKLYAFKKQMNSAVTFHTRYQRLRVFNAWKIHSHRVKTNRLTFYSNRTTLQNVMISFYLCHWQKMLTRKLEADVKVELAKSKFEVKLKRTVFSAWTDFISKLNSIRGTKELFPKLKSAILFEIYTFHLLEKLIWNRALIRKEEQANKAEERFLKRKYLRRWISFLWWKKETILKCICDGVRYENSGQIRFEESGVEERFERRQPIIPDYLRTEFDFDAVKPNRIKGPRTSSPRKDLTFRVIEPVNKCLPVVGQNEVFLSPNK